MLPISRTQATPAMSQAAIKSYNNGSGMQSRGHQVRFSSHVYQLETIKRAAYRFTGRVAFDFVPENEDIVCHITMPSLDGNQEEIETIISEFKNEVLDQDLRRTIADETSANRNIILAHVFSKTGLQNVE